MRFRQSVAGAVREGQPGIRRYECVGFIRASAFSSRTRITESVLLDKSERNIAILNQLRALGVRISMDDFGTGYSSIAYLRSFPFDKIKIDQSFVRDVLVDEGSLAIVRAIAGLGVSFGMITTAEGVETEEQMRCLISKAALRSKGTCTASPCRRAR